MSFPCPSVTCITVLVALAALSLPCEAATLDTRTVSTAIAPTPTATLGEQLENLGRVYQDKNNPVVQEFWLLGRYHAQQHWIDGSNGRYEESLENRRLRMGFQGKFFNKLTLHAQMVSGTDLEPFYNGFTELWAQWSFNDALNLTIGQQKHRFTHDRNISSRYINYLERGMLTNMFGLDYTPAVTLSGKGGRFSYYTGLFSNATGPSMGNSFTKLNSGWSYLASLTYDLGHPAGLDAAHLNVSYLYSDFNARATNLNRFYNGFSTALILAEGPMSLVTEITSGLGGTRGAAHGINFQPGIFLTDKLQLVGRYQFAFSERETGLSAQRRYERNVGLNTGDRYHAGYLGLNYHIARHRLKIMTGAEYAKMNGQDSWMGMVAFRFFFGPHSKGPFPMAQTLDGVW
ncbi:porin [Prosthecobacter sp.]|uniref:porin n=1 Tax=Prosthecobacter sp. TaxID=1965333 RepID=UPI002AC9067F|nr:porin [Prosthecobacter sp.]